MAIRNDFYVDYGNGGFGHAEIRTRKKIANLIDDKFPDIIDNSKCGWKAINDGKKEVLLEIDYKNRQEVESLKKLEKWISTAKELIWRFYPNKNFSDYFDGSELEFCVSCDWNINPNVLKKSNDWSNLSGNQYTNMGLSVHRLKTEPLSARYKGDLEIIINGIKKCMECLPISNNNVAVTIVPYINGEEMKLDRILACNISRIFNVNFLETTFYCQKTKTKDLSVEDKLLKWNDILLSKEHRIDMNVIKNGEIIWSVNDLYKPCIYENFIKENNFIIIDDLYQSGASVWAYAKFLKKIHMAQKVFAITAVKALGDNDNTHNEFIAEVSGFEGTF